MRGQQNLGFGLCVPKALSCDIPESNSRGVVVLIGYSPPCLHTSQNTNSHTESEVLLTTHRGVQYDCYQVGGTDFLSGLDIACAYRDITNVLKLFQI